MAGFTIPRAFVSMDPWSGTLLVGMPRGVTLPDGRDVGGYSLRKYADEREKTDWRGEEGIRVTLDDGFPARLQRGRGDDVEAVFVDASVLADAVKTRLDSALRAVEDMAWTPAVRNASIRIGSPGAPACTRITRRRTAGGCG